MSRGVQNVKKKLGLKDKLGRFMGYWMGWCTWVMGIWSGSWFQGLSFLLWSFSLFSYFLLSALSSFSQVICFQTKNTDGVHTDPETGDGMWGFRRRCGGRCCSATTSEPQFFIFCFGFFFSLYTLADFPYFSTYSLFSF